MIQSNYTKGKKCQQIQWFSFTHRERDREKKNNQKSDGYQLFYWFNIITKWEKCPKTCNVYLVLAWHGIASHCITYIRELVCIGHNQVYEMSTVRSPIFVQYESRPCKIIIMIPIYIHIFILGNGTNGSTQFYPVMSSWIKNDVDSFLCDHNSFCFCFHIGKITKRFFVIRSNMR